MSTEPVFTTIEEIAAEGRRIYHETLQEELERSSKWQYVAIDVLTGKYYVRQSETDALMEARKDTPYGVFHLIRIGVPVKLGSRHVGQQETR